MVQFTIKHCILLVFLITSVHAQVVGHPGGGGPARKSESEEYCENLLATSIEVEEEFLKIRKKLNPELANKMDIFSELERLQLKVVSEIMATINVDLFCPIASVNRSQLTFSEEVLLKKIRQVWTEGSKVEDHCMKKFNRRSNLIQELEFVINFYDQKSGK